MTVPPLTRDQCRAIDRRAIEEYGIASLVLMENAGRGCVDVLERLGIDGPVVILCGKGNNTGDGFVIARHLEIRGHTCRVLLLCPPEELRGDAATNFAILQKTGVEIEVGAAAWTERAEVSRAAHVGESLRSKIRRGEDSQDRVSERRGHVDWLVDAMLGTGAVGEPRPPFDAAIDWMNSQPAKKLAIDVPSGLDCDTGQPAAHTIRADHTCTFAAMKIGFLQPIAKPFTGEVHVCDIGVPPGFIEDIQRNN